MPEPDPRPEPEVQSPDSRHRRPNVRGEHPIARFGPYPTAVKGAHLSLTIWKRDVTEGETGEVTMQYEVSITRTYYNTQNEPVTSDTIRSSEIPLAILLLEQAQKWVEAERSS